MKKTLQFLSVIACLFALPTLSFTQTSSCSNPTPICGSNGLQDYPLSVQNPVNSMTNDYQCLDPWGPLGKAWHYFQVSQSGDLHFNLTVNSVNAGAVIWGPFSSIAQANSSCGALTNVATCDTESGGQLHLSINNAVAGQVYLMLVTSEEYPSTFTFNQSQISSPSSGSTNCSITGVTPPPPPPTTFNNSCATPAPICGVNSTAGYPLVIETPLTSMTNDYQCLDPWGPLGKAWHYFEVSQSGNLYFNLGMHHPNSGAIIWGPFPNLATASASCGSLNNVVDCDYDSGFGTGNNDNLLQLGVSNATAGEVYLMLVTSAAYPSTFTFEQVLTNFPNTGSTDCSIVGNLAVGCPETIFMDSCKDEIPDPYPTAADFFNAGGTFGSTCSGYVSLSSYIVADNNGTGCAGNARSVVRAYEAVNVCGDIGRCFQTISFPEVSFEPIPTCPPTIGITCRDQLTPDFHIQYATAITDCNLDYTYQLIDSSMITSTFNQICDFSEFIYDVLITDACGQTATCELRYSIIGADPVFLDDTNPDPNICELPPLVKECNDPQIDHDQLIEDWINGMQVVGNCGEAVQVTTDYDEDNFVYTCGLAGSQVVTFTATDACGRTSTCTGTITNIDTKPPYISNRADDITVNCSDDVQAEFDDWLNNYGGLFGIDCCTPISFSYEPANPTIPNACEGENSTTVTFFILDECGLSTPSEATFTLEGSGDLTLDSDAMDMTADCGDDAAFQNWLDNNGGATASNCGAITWSYTPDDAALSGTCNETIEVTFTGADACGATITTTATYTTIDTIAPVFTTIPVNADDMAVAEDACDTDVTITTEETTGTNACESVKTWTATDDCGNSATVSIVLDGGETNPPVFDFVPADATIDCAATPVFGDPIASDAEGAVTITFEDVANGSTSITRTWTATDACGNTATASQTLTFDDTTPPTFSNLPIDLTFTCGDDIIIPDPTVIDDCSTVTLTFVDTLNQGAVIDDCNNGFGYDIFRTYTATDAFGNVSTATIETWVVPEDYMGPEFKTVPESVMMSCGDTPVFGEAVCESACGDVVMTFEDIMIDGDCNTEGTYTRIWTGIDACGNTATASQTLTMPIDDEAPVFTFVPENKMIACGETPTFGTPTCIDNCSTIDHINVSFEDADLSSECAILRTWTVLDACGNMSQATQKITIDDQDAPVLSTIVAEKTIACGQAFEFDTPTTSDVCSTSELTFTDETVVSACAVGETRIRTWMATDACGNMASVTQRITMEDNEAPIFEGTLENQMIVCGAVAEFTEPSVSDACSTVELTFEDENMLDDCENGDLFKRTWTATDACGNAAQVEQIFTTMPDETAPTFSAIPENKMIACGEEMIFDNIAATDVCSGVELTFTDEVVNDLCAYSYGMTRTWVAVDACGNMNTTKQTITMEDNTAPEFMFVPESMQLACDASFEYGEPEVIDGCSAVSLTYEDIDTFDSCSGDTFQRIWTATDACGNASQATQTISFMADVTAPTFTSTPEDQVITCGMIMQFDNVAATDFCSGVEVIFEDETIEGTCANNYSIRRTWTAADPCGNASVISQTISMEDNEAPIFETVPADEIMTAAELELWVPATPTFQDACSDVTLNTDLSNNANCEDFKFIYTWEATDACGNMASAETKVTVTDVLPEMEVTVPSEVVCGQNYDISATTIGGLGTYELVWSVDNADWSIDENTMLLNAGEGTALLTIVATNEYGCTVEREVEVTCQTTGIVALNNEAGFDIAPNPTSSRLNINFIANEADQATIRIFDLLGQEMMTRSVAYQIGENTEILNVSDLAEATYMVVIQTGKTQYTQKFIKVQ